MNLNNGEKYTINEEGLLTEFPHVNFSIYFIYLLSIHYYLRLLFWKYTLFSSPDACLLFLVVHFRCGVVVVALWYVSAASIFSREFLLRSAGLMFRAAEIKSFGKAGTGWYVSHTGLHVFCHLFFFEPIMMCVFLTWSHTHNKLPLYYHVAFDNLLWYSYIPQFMNMVIIHYNY